MTEKKEKKKKSPVFFAVVIVMMAAIYVVQMIVPTNLGKLYSELSDTVVEITVTKTKAKDKSGSYFTSSQEKMAEFQKWADEKKMKPRSIADSLTADAQSMVKYNFAIKLSDGSYNALVIDEKGYVHVGAELYLVTGSAETFIRELKTQLESWKEE